MHITVDDFKTGWFGVAIGVKELEIETLIEGLRQISANQSHFHGRSTFTESCGVADIEFYIQGANQADNITIDTSLPIFPAGSNPHR